MSAQPRWDDSAPAQRPVAVPTSGAVAEPDRNAARIVSVIALASIAAGAINIAAAATIGGDNAQTHLFFGVVGAAQVVWGLLALVWAPRWWLVLGALGNAVVVATWLVSRTVGLPFGQFAHVVLPVRFPDSVATILAAVTVVGAVVLVVRGSGTARAAARVRGFALAAAVVIGALGLAGVLSQTNAFASGGGGGGQNGPTAPHGGYGGGGGLGRRLRLLTGNAARPAIRTRGARPFSGRAPRRPRDPRGFRQCRRSASSASGSRAPGGRPSVASLSAVGVRRCEADRPVRPGSSGPPRAQRVS